MKFRTKIEIAAMDFRVKYENNLLFVGSCFSDHIAQRLNALNYKVFNNPFGTLYNPASIQQSLALLFSDHIFKASDLFQHEGLWSSFLHHSDFSRISPEESLQVMNDTMMQARMKLMDMDHLFITFGTAWTFIHKETNEVVANCHRLPAAHFTRKRMTVEDIVEHYDILIRKLKKINPGLKIIFTISPVRYLKDGFHENQLSKAILQLAVEALYKQHSGVYYFPAYEILNDDLRDYRFYDNDLVHPSQEAVQYVFENFESVFLEPSEQHIRKVSRALHTARMHKVRYSGTEQHQKFIRTQLDKINHLQSICPILELMELRNFFSSQLKHK